MKLQSGTAGIMDAFLSIEEIKGVYVELRTNVNTHFNKIFLQAKEWVMYFKLNLLSVGYLHCGYLAWLVNRFYSIYLRSF